MPEVGEKKISPVAVIGIGLGLGVAAVLGIAAVAWAAPPKVYICPVCGAEFASEEELLAHIELYHPEVPPPVVYTCPYCGAEFATEEELQQHLTIEHPETPIAQFAYVSDVRHYIQRVVDTNYEVFEVDVQNQGDSGGTCLVIAAARYKLEEGWSDFKPFKYDTYRRLEAEQLKVDSAYLNPNEIVTFREALWKWAYLDLGASALYIKFDGDAGEILSSRVSI